MEERWLIIKAIILVMIVVGLIVGLIISRRRSYKSNPSMVRYCNGKYIVDQYEETRGWRGYSSYEYKLKGKRLVPVWQRPSKIHIILVVMAGVFIVPATIISVSINDYTMVMIIGVLFLILCSMMLPQTDLRAKRTIAKAIQEGTVSRSPLSKVHYDYAIKCNNEQGEVVPIDCLLDIDFAPMHGHSGRKSEKRLKRSRNKNKKAK